MSRSPQIVVAALLAMAVATAAQAQINSPPPPLQGATSYHLWSVPGVMRVAGIAPFFACTNTTNNAIRVGVEVFASFGGAAVNDPSATSLNVGAGAAVLFGSLAVGLFPDSDPGIPPMQNGSARILATAKSGIICGAFLADDGNAPPTFMSDLTVVKSIKQKGD